MANHTDDSLELYSDEQLTAFAKNGNQVALSLLFKRYSNLLSAKARAFSQGYVNDYEDFLQEGKIGFYKAILNFSEQRSPYFASYAKFCVERQIINFVKKFKTQKNVEQIIDDATIKGPEELFLQKENLQETLSMIDVVLSDLEKKVLLFYLMGYSYFQISQKIDRDIKSVDNALNRIKSKMRF